MIIKPGVSVRKIESEMVLACFIIDPICKKYDSKRLTAGTDGVHRPGSLHYVGLAIDISLPLKDLVNEFVKEIKEALGEDLKNNIISEFEVLVEKDHVHIEFQPKDKR